MRNFKFGYSTADPIHQHTGDIRTGKARCECPKAISDVGTPAPGEMLVLSQQAQVSLTQADKIDLMTKSTVQQAGKADAELASRT